MKASKKKPKYYAEKHISFAFQKKVFSSTSISHESNLVEWKKKEKFFLVLGGSRKSQCKENTWFYTL